MENPIITIELALAVINFVGISVSNTGWFEENVNKIIRWCLVGFDLATIIIIFKLI